MQRNICKQFLRNCVLFQMVDKVVRTKRHLTALQGNDREVRSGIFRRHAIGNGDFACDDISILPIQPRSGQSPENRTAGHCFSAKTAQFFDDHYARTYIMTSSGLTPLSKTDRSHKIRCRYLFNRLWYDSGPFTDPALESFWGRSHTEPTSPFIAALDSEGRGAIGIGFDHSMGLLQNSDSEHHCMHSTPFFGTLGPGQTAQRKGVILLGADVRELFDRFQALGDRPDFTPP